MNSNPRSRAGRILSLIFLVLALCGFAGWRAVQPRISTASLAEVEDALPKELLELDASDPAAEKRIEIWNSSLGFPKVSGFPGSSSDDKYATIADPKKSTAIRLKAAKDLFTDSRLDHIEAYLDGGPIRYKPPTIRQLTISELGKVIAADTSFTTSSKAKQLEKSLQSSVSLFEDAGDQNRAFRCVGIALKFDERFRDMRGVLIHYLVGLAIDSIAMRAAQLYATDARTSAEDCKKLLDLIPPAPLSDEYLATAIRSEFQSMVLPRLPDPYLGFARMQAENKSDPENDALPRQEDPANGEVPSSYDALETSRSAGQIMLALLKNTGRL